MLAEAVTPRRAPPTPAEAPAPSPAEPRPAAAAPAPLVTPYTEATPTTSDVLSAAVHDVSDAAAPPTAGLAEGATDPRLMAVLEEAG